MKTTYLALALALTLGGLSQTSHAFQRVSRTFNTTLTPNRALGESITVTWSIVKDGTETGSSYTDDSTILKSDYISVMDERHSIPEADRTDDLTNRSWFKQMELGLSYISAKTRITFIYVDYDDGSKLDINNTVAGTLGVRADLRVGGLNLNNSGFIPGGYSFAFNKGAVTAVTMNSAYEAYSDITAIRGVFMHEVGHALGLRHSYVNMNIGNNMMGYNANGPQFDEIYALQQNHGDTYEGETDNDSIANSYNLGTITPGSSTDIGTDIQAGGIYEKMTSTENDIVAISNDSDTDYYSFTINEANNMIITVEPRGPDSYVFAIVTPTNPTYAADPIRNSNLSFNVYDSSNALISSTNDTANGSSESVTLDLPAGTYYIRVNGELINLSNSGEFISSNDDLGSTRAQFYALTAQSTEDPPFQPLPAALAHWPMDEGSSTNVTDIAGNHYDGALTQTSNWRTGQIDGALNFTGSAANQITLPATPFSALSTEITLSLWTYISDTTAAVGYPLRAFSSDGSEVLRLTLPNGQNRYFFETWENGTLERLLQPLANVPENGYRGAWHHWVFTKNSATGFMKVYINGELEQTQANRTGLMEGISTVAIGTRYFGLIDDFIMWDKEISADQVRSLYNNTPPKALALSLDTDLNTSVITTLSGIESDEQELSYMIDQAPTNGNLSGTAPNLTYTPNTGYTGVDSYTYYVNDGVVNSYPETVSITVTGGGYDTWADGYSDASNAAGLDDFDSDSDGDGIANGIEYILNTNPAATESMILPTFEKTNNQLVISFERNATSTDDTTQVLQYGYDLSQWTAIPLAQSSANGVQVEAINDDMESVTVSIDNADNTDKRLFYRLKVTRN